MRQLSIVIIIILGALISAPSQSKSVGTNRTATSASAKAPTKTKLPQLKYLTVSLDLNQTNLGQNFAGHDITAVVAAIQASPSLQKKSEFETTSAFEERRSGFAGHFLYAGMMPSGYFAFVVGEEPLQPPKFEYDADAQRLVVTLQGRDKEFMLDQGRPKEMRTLEVRYNVLQTNKYLGSNAFGATAEVEITRSREYSVAFDKGTGPFRSYGIYELSFSLPMSPEDAKSLKPVAKLLLVCRLTEPWIHYDTHSEKATVDWPYESYVEADYLQVVPEQFWVFNQRTGQIVAKVTKSLTISEN